MTIEDKIKNIDCQLFAIKLEVELKDNLVDIYWTLKKEKGVLLKRKNR